MTVERQDILEDWYSGNDKTIRVQVFADVGLTIPKPDLDQAEISYALFDELTGSVRVRKSSVQGASEIDVVDVGNAIVEVYCVGKDTRNVYGTFRHQMHVFDVDGKEEMAMTGKVNIFQAFATRYRTAIVSAFLQGG